MLKRGFIGKAYLYDINSAYPFAITKIPDLSNGKWIQSKSIHEKAKLGFFKIRSNIPGSLFLILISIHTRNLSKNYTKKDWI